MADLVSALIDREIAEHRLGPQLQDRLPKRVRFQAGGLPRRIDQEPACRVRSGRLNGGRTFEFVLIRGDERLVARIWQARLPERTAIDELGVASELLVIFRQQPVWDAAQ